MQELINLFFSADLYYEYSEGETYKNGKKTIQKFKEEYNKLSEQDQSNFYTELKRQSAGNYTEEYLEHKCNFLNVKTNQNEQ